MILPRDAMHSAAYAVARCLSVRHVRVLYKTYSKTVFTDL